MEIRQEGQADLAGIDCLAGPSRDRLARSQEQVKPISQDHKFQHVRQLDPRTLLILRKTDQRPLIVEIKIKQPGVSTRDGQHQNVREDQLRRLRGDLAVQEGRGEAV